MGGGGPGETTDRLAMDKADMTSAYGAPEQRTVPYRAGRPRVTAWAAYGLFLAAVVLILAVTFGPMVG